MLTRRLLPSLVKRLSVLSNADEGSLTYYTGVELGPVSHLRRCALLVGPEFHQKLPEEWGVEVIQTHSAQEVFYRLSEEFKEDFLESERLQPSKSAWVHPEAKLGAGVKLGPGSVIGNCVLEDGVTVGPQALVYSKSHIKEGTSIGASTVVGAPGMMWVWGGAGKKEKIFLEQLGGVEIGSNCRIGSNITIVRGNANEVTKIGNDVCIAHGSMVGHGCRIDDLGHLANKVALGGSVVLGKACFLGSGATVSPGNVLTDGVVLGAGATLVKNAVEPGVYVGCPAVRKEATKRDMRGVPKWR